MRLWKNSKYVKNGDYFLVDKDNQKYVNNAIENGAKKIITEIDGMYDVETIKVESINDYIKGFYNDKIDNMKLIGITGTNGKTTTCYLIYQMLNYIGVKTAYIGTIGFYIDGLVKELDNTTPSIDILYNLILDAKEKGCLVVVMEASSHALKQERLYGLLFDAVGITNITQDHLDYHKNMKDYIKSKKKIINMLKNKRICILNKKDKYYKRFKKRQNNNYIIGKDVKVSLIKNNLYNTSIVVKDKIKKGFNLSMVGNFNVYNFLYAYYIIEKLGFNLSKMKNNYYVLSEPPGRMQKIKYNSNVIFIDYAHTPDAVEKVLKTVKKLKNKAIITIIGCGGERDKEKRPIMANKACKNSSFVIFTNDNPRREDERKIMKDILKGAKGKYEVIYDRYDAIKKGIKMLNNNMILMVLGKGHENYQIINKEKKYFSDYDSIINIIDNI